MAFDKPNSYKNTHLAKHTLVELHSCKRSEKVVNKW
jgi:hypothetical protein